MKSLTEIFIGIVLELLISLREIFIFRKLTPLTHEPVISF